MRNNLAELRQARKITQAGLAEHVSVTRQTIISVEKGRYVPSVLLAIRIARVLKLKVEDIFYE